MSEEEYNGVLAVLLNSGCEPNEAVRDALTAVAKFIVVENLSLRIYVAYLAEAIEKYNQELE